MTNQIKILIGILVIVVVLSGVFIYNKFLTIRTPPISIPSASEKPIASEKLEVKEENIGTTIPLKSQIVVGLDEYHVGRTPCWDKGTTVFRGMPLGTNEFLNYLKKENIKTEIINSKITPEILENINILIIAYPVEPFSESEKETLRDFLSKGGGVLLAASHYGGTEESRVFVVNDIAESLNLNIKFHNYSCNTVPNNWTKEIIEYELITSGINAVLTQCGYIDVGISTIPLVKQIVKQEKKVIYAIQYYSKGKMGKIGIVASGEVFTNQIFDACSQCQELNLNLIKWLATPLTPQEIEELE